MTINYEKALDEFTKQTANGQRAGSGDDEEYVSGVYAYVKKNREMWIAFAKFIDMLKRCE